LAVCTLPLLPRLWQAGAGVVSLYQLFLCLAVFCEGPVVDKATFCFHLFDEDNSGMLDPRELSQFIATIVEALFLIGEVAVQPKEAAIHRLCSWCFMVRLPALRRHCGY
jgi:hypothetical protein